MIDTDKYEGHSVAWGLDPDDWTWAINMFTAAGKTNEADALLIEDAPLLLEEVKRLRKITDFVKSSIDFHYHSIDNNTGGFVDWMEFARELHFMFYDGRR
mgnify:CR=1 FL=1